MAVAAAMLAACARVAQAGWPTVASQVVTLQPGGSSTMLQDACPDGAGGSFACWGAGSMVTMYLQHLDAFGEGRFAGGPFAFEPGNGNPLRLAPDGQGGVGVLMQLFPGGSGASLALRRIDSSGQLLWSVPVWTGPYSNNFWWHRLAVDPAGTGWTIAWLDGNAPSARVRAQFVELSGAMMWNPAGVVVDSSSYALTLGPVTADGAGGAWVCWIVGSSPPSLRLQHLDAGGAPRWPGAGITVVTSPTLWDAWQLVADGAGGAWISWLVSGAADASDRLQHVRADGSLAFGTDGLSLPGPPPERRGEPALGPAGPDRVFVTWMANDALHGWTARLQLLDTTGTWVWPAALDLVQGGAGEYLGLRVYPLADGSAVVTVFPTADWMNAAQRVGPDGTPWWPAPAPMMRVADAMQTTYALNEIFVPPFPDSDGALTCFRTFADSGMGLQPDAYFLRAQHLDAFGRLGDTAPRIEGFADVPADTGGWLDLRWRASSLEGDATMATVAYDVLRRGPDGATLQVVAEQAATGAAEYVARVPTLADSTSPSSPRTTYRIRAHDAAARAWTSPPDSAWSIANSPPLAVAPRDGASLALEAPEPNPATTSIRIRYSLPTDSEVTLSLFDAAGRRACALARGRQAAGPHVAVFASVAGLPPGRYFVRLEVPGRSLARPLVLVR